MEEKSGFHGNLALLRVCTIMLIAGSLHKTLGLSWTLLMSEANDDTLIWAYVPFGLLVAVLGVIALVKKNSLVLMAYSVIAFVATVWKTILDAQERFITAFYIGDVAIGFLFNSFFVVCVATFFIEPERTRCYLQKAKQKFFSWKKLT